MSCIQELKRLLQSNMPNETILITSTAGEGRRLLKACIRDGGLVVGTKTLTPLALALEILEDVSEPGTVPQLLSKGEQQDLVYRALEDMPEEGFFALQHVKERKTAELFLDVIQELNREDIGPVSGNERLSALQAVREAYQAGKNSTTDESDLLKLAIQKAGSCDAYGNTRFVVFSSEVFPALDRRLIETVAGDRLTVVHVNSPNGMPAPSQCFSSCGEETDLNTAEFRFWRCRGIEAETEAVMRDIISSGKQAEDCAVVFLSPEYQTAIAKSAELFHVPVTISGGIPVRGSSAFAVIHMLSDWEHTDFNAETLRSLILNDLLTFAESRRFALKLRPMNVGWGEQRYFDCLRRDREKADAGTETPYDEWEKVLELLFSISKRTGTMEEQKSCLKELLDHHINVKGEEDASALAMAKSLLNQITWLEEEESVLGRLLELLSGASCMSRQEHAGKLFALPLSEAFCTGRKVLYVCGMSRFCLQGGAESPVFLDVERKQAGLTDMKEREDLNTFRLMQVLSQHEGETVISYCGYDTERMIDLEPALLYRELLGERKPEEITLVAENRYTIGDLAASGAPLLVTEPEPDEMPESTEQAELVEAKSYEQQLAEVVFSASSMETALECPFKFYLQKILKLYAEKVPEKSYDTWLEQNDFGTLCHEVLARYYENPAPDWHAILDDEVRIMKEKHPAGPDAAVSAQIQEAERMISRAIDWTHENGRDVLATELGFGTKFGTEPVTLNVNGKTIQLSGSIDRVDRLRDGSISIIDYKTGKPNHYREHLEIKLQPYLYAQAAKQLNRELEVQRAGYLFLKDTAFYLQAWQPSAVQDREANKIASLLDWIATEEGALTDIPDFTFDDTGAISGLGSKSGDTEHCSKFCDYLELCKALRKMRADTAATQEVTGDE